MNKKTEGMTRDVAPLDEYLKETVAEEMKERLMQPSSWRWRLSRSIACKEYTSYYRKLATKTVYIQQEELQEH